MDEVNRVQTYFLKYTKIEYVNETICVDYYPLDNGIHDSNQDQQGKIIVWIEMVHLLLEGDLWILIEAMSLLDVVSSKAFLAKDISSLADH